jgi:hypothetical protein
MSQGLKYLKEENMEEIIASYTFHTTLNTLKNSKYTEANYKYPETNKAEIEAVRSWLKWTYNEIMTEEFFDSLINLEDEMQIEILTETKVHEVLETVMLVQEISENKIIDQMQKISQDIEETHEDREDPLKEAEIQEDRENRNKFINEELKNYKKCSPKERKD